MSLPTSSSAAANTQDIGPSPSTPNDFSSSSAPVSRVSDFASDDTQPLHRHRTLSRTSTLPHVDVVRKEQAPPKRKLPFAEDEMVDKPSRLTGLAETDSVVIPGTQVPDFGTALAQPTPTVLPIATVAGKRFATSRGCQSDGSLENARDRRLIDKTVVVALGMVSDTAELDAVVAEVVRKCDRQIRAERANIEANHWREHEIEYESACEFKRRLIEYCERVFMPY